MITILIGKSGAGKDTFLKQAVKLGMKPVVSYTTRPMREGEKNGEDYNFVSPKEFKKLKAEGMIAESRSYDTLVGGVPDTWYYGSPKLNAEGGHIAVLTPDGAMSYIGIYGAEVLDIYLIEVNETIRKERAKKRGSFDETEWNRRAADDEDKFSEAEIRKLEKVYGRKVKRIDNNYDLPPEAVAWMSLPESYRKDEEVSG